MVALLDGAEREHATRVPHRRIAGRAGYWPWLLVVLVVGAVTQLGTRRLPGPIMKWLPCRVIELQSARHSPYRDHQDRDGASRHGRLRPVDRLGTSAGGGRSLWVRSSWGRDWWGEPARTPRSEPKPSPRCRSARCGHPSARRSRISLSDDSVKASWPATTSRSSRLRPPPRSRLPQADQPPASTIEQGTWAVPDEVKPGT